MFQENKENPFLIYLASQVASYIKKWRSMTINNHSHDDDDDDDDDDDNDNDNGGDRHPTPLWKHHSALSTSILTLKIQPGIADTPVPW